VVDYPELKKAVLVELMGRYVKEVLEHRKGWRSDCARMEMFMREPWAQLDCTADIAAALRARKKVRLAEVSGQSFNRELGLLVGFFDYAVKEWGLRLPNNPAKQILRAKESPAARRLVWSNELLYRMLDHFGFSLDRGPATPAECVGWVILLLRSTGLRLGTLCSIRMADIHLDRKLIRFGADQVKNSEAWDCPLSDNSIALIRRLMGHRQGETRLLPEFAYSSGRLFREGRDSLAKTEPEVGNLHLHGLRKTWTTENAGKITDPKLLLKITGRKNMKVLIDNYYDPSATELAEHLN
jgi:integrase